jgi:hypothetical protein
MSSTSAPTLSATQRAWVTAFATAFTLGAIILLGVLG